MSTHPRRVPIKDSTIWQNVCLDCGTSNAERAGVVPTSCAGCGTSPIRLLVADPADIRTWMTTPQDQTRIDKHAEAKRAQRADRLARMARAALAIRRQETSNTDHDTKRAEP